MFALTLADTRRHSREARATRVKIWHAAEDEATCGQSSVFHDTRVTKPASLCDTYEVSQHAYAGPSF